MNPAENANHHAPAKPLVRFYVFPHASRDARLQLACQLSEKAQQNGQKTLLLCEDEAMRAELDALLWNFRDASFVTHALPESDLAAHAAVILLVPPERGQRGDIFINLSLEAQPDIPRGCTRVFEIVTNQPDVLTATRKRFAAYRERGLEPETHKLKK
ncbi:MAG: DNA polymerase III subunit chi [Cardiobacteriaceae bacterium]|nr:DNA polymerase III subunit chi [Cardiobacteriaceae bacterium]